MTKFNKEAFKHYLENRQEPETIPKTLIFNGITIKNVPAIKSTAEDNDFTMPLQTTSQILHILSKDDVREVEDFNQKFN